MVSSIVLSERCNSSTLHAWLLDIADLCNFEQIIIKAIKAGATMNFVMGTNLTCVCCAIIIHVISHHDIPEST